MSLDGNDITQMFGDRSYTTDITVNSGAGNDTYNVKPDFDNLGFRATFNGEAGDDLLYADYADGVPNGIATVTFNGGANEAGGDTLRVAGDGVATGTYAPSGTAARAGLVNVSDNVFDFTGVEPLVVHGLSDFDVNGRPISRPIWASTACGSPT